MKKLLIVFLSLTLCLGVFLPMSASAEPSGCKSVIYVTVAWLCCRNVQKA